MLLDTASLYFRAFHGIPESITAPDGTPVNAVRGLVDFIATLVRNRRPTHLVACLDADWRPAFRSSALPSYKLHRLGPDGHSEQIPPGLLPQIPIIDDVLDAVGIARVGAAGYEADDVIGTLANHATMPVEIVTGDRDLFQLVDDARGIRVLNTARGVGKLEVVDEAAVSAKYDIPGRAYADFALLRGDPSDGLPGVPGIGAKTAAALISSHGTLEKLLVAVDDPASGLSPTVRARLRSAQAYLEVAPEVVQVAREIPLPALDTRLPAAPKDPEKLVELADRWNLDSPLNRLLGALRPAD